MEDFISRVINKPLKAEILKFFFENKNIFDSAESIAMWLNENTEEIKGILFNFEKEKILKNQGEIYSYEPDESIISEIENFYKEYTLNKQNVIRKIKSLEGAEHEFQKKIEKLERELYEKNKSLIIIRELNKIFNSFENINESIKDAMKLVKYSLEADYICIEYGLGNLSGKYLISKEEKNIDIKEIDAGKKISYSYYEYNLYSEKRNSIGKIIIGKDVEKNNEIEKEKYLMETMAGVIAEGLQKYDYFIEKTEKEKIEADLKVAQKIQESYIKKQSPDLKKFDYAVKYIPAKLVGGDYYDWFKIDEENYSFVIGDVTGKGSAAAMFMIKVRENFKIFSKEIKSPSKIMERINKSLIEDVDVEKFITVFYVNINIENKELCFANAGHDPMLLLKNGEIEEKTIKNVPLGIMPEIKFYEEKLELNTGDIIVIYTDGIVEARNIDREFYGFERFKSILMKNSQKKSNEIIEAVINDINKFVGEAPQHDDLTIFVIKTI